ncbi:hypothetical protein I4F81_008200 [Pyropia yezoensis]|uniref:Uncharacterized protein n=1 Tax=Pyropia yezoensis TaxID=2788 RepID=A0ACC3C7G4_PYRYE|nr:hypothetical protein I4F81_008200 [Neopyropia yezoensis]
MCSPPTLPTPASSPSLYAPLETLAFPRSLAAAAAMQSMLRSSTCRARGCRPSTTPSPPGKRRRLATLPPCPPPSACTLPPAPTSTRCTTCYLPATKCSCAGNPTPPTPLPCTPPSSTTRGRTSPKLLPSASTSLPPATELPTWPATRAGYSPASRLAALPPTLPPTLAAGAATIGAAAMAAASSSPTAAAGVAADGIIASADAAPPPRDAGRAAANRLTRRVITRGGPPQAPRCRLLYWGEEQHPLCCLPAAFLPPANPARPPRLLSRLRHHATLSTTSRPTPACLLWGFTAPLGLGASPFRGRRIVATSAPDQSGAGGGRSSLGRGTPRHPRWIPP